jgi:hypothetical protein
LLNFELSKRATIDELYDMLIENFKPNIRKFQQDYTAIYNGLKKEKYNNYQFILDSTNLLPEWLLEIRVENAYVLDLLNKKIKEPIYVFHQSPDMDFINYNDYDAII